MLDVIASQTTIRRPDQLTQKFFVQPVTRVRHLTEDRMYGGNTPRPDRNAGHSATGESGRNGTGRTQRLESTSTQSRHFD